MIDQYQMLRDVSRTFALSIEQLPTGVRNSITVAYLLLRVSDCLEDNDEMCAGRKAQLLRLWDRVLDGEAPVEELEASVAHLDGSDPEVEVAQRAGEVLTQLDALPAPVQGFIRQYVRCTTRGMARWQEQGPFVDDEEEMDDYMHHVAGIVGYLLTEIFAYYSPVIRERKDELMPLAREYGLALQTVNVIRGLRKDFERGWIFVPRTFCEKVGLAPAELFDEKNLDRAMQVVDMLVEKAERHLAHGMGFITAFPRREHRVRLACMWPLFFAAKTLAISRGDTRVLLAEAKIGRDNVRKIMRDTKFFGWSNHWLQWYYNHLAQEPHALAASHA
jgi:farnesyl-diphosphate farnesyltransferase